MKYKYHKVDNIYPDDLITMNEARVKRFYKSHNNSVLSPCALYGSIIVKDLITMIRLKKHYKAPYKSDIVRSMFDKLRFVIADSC